MSAQNVQGAHYDSNLPAAHERLHQYDFPFYSIPLCYRIYAHFNCSFGYSFLIASIYIDKVEVLMRNFKRR